MDSLSDCRVHLWVCGSYSSIEKAEGVSSSGDGTPKSVSREGLQFFIQVPRSAADALTCLADSFTKGSWAFDLHWCHDSDQ